MLTTSDLTKGLIKLFYSKKNSNTNTGITYDQKRNSQKKAWKDALSNNSSSSSPSQTGGSSSESSSGSGIISSDDAYSDELSGNGGSDGSVDGTGGEGDSSGGTTSPLLEGSMSFEELVGEICNGIDLIFATKRSTVVITDYESIYAEAKYLRDKKSKAIKGEDLQLHELQEGTYELDVSEYGFYNVVKVHYKNGVVTESYEDLVRVYGEKTIDYYEKSIDKTTAIMKAKAYLAAHVRDFDMSIKANILWNGNIDIGDIITLENPLTMRDKTRVEVEKRDPEYYFVVGKNVEWEGEQPITGTVELRYGAVSPEKKDVPETGTGYSDGSGSSSGGDIESAVDEVGQLASGISYSGACQTHDCVQSKQTGDCHGMSDFIACELKSRGVEAKIYQYVTSYANNHRSVKYKDASGQWSRFPYRKYNVDAYFRDTDGVESGSEIKSTCG